MDWVEPRVPWWFLDTKVAYSQHQRRPPKFGTTLRASGGFCRQRKGMKIGKAGDCGGTSVVVLLDVATLAATAIVLTIIVRRKGQKSGKNHHRHQEVEQSLPIELPETLSKENDQDNASKPITHLYINGAVDMDVIEDDSDLFLFIESLKLVILFLILVLFMLMMSHMMKEIELVVGSNDDEEMRTDLKERMSMRSSIRHVFEDIKIKDDKLKKRVSICILPKNALLLMRCRSDRMKMAALTNRFSWDANAASKQEDVNEGRENIDKEIEDIEEQLYVQECEVADEVDNEIPQQNVGVSIEQEIPAEAKLEMPQNDLLL
ncbi:Uncharacterized protein Adt_23810 [Abeliophyllum distichum]|uniref:Transmembrane protein n=1 Tax=Abeliophyllum distichum TaxID=126358 RepID=A0ABD1SC53_9LAMI